MRHGFLLVHKPVGPTSHDVVAMVRRTLPERSVGHLGTLDPAAEGLLVLAVGSKALKVVELFKDLPKEYEAHIHFGAVSTTYDREGVIEEIAPKPGWTVPDPMTIQGTLRDRFTGKIAQVPPAASAVKIGGERAYRKMRQGKSFDLPARDVEIKESSIMSYTFPDLHLRVCCGSGTYIRSLAHDLGQALRCGGYLAALKRTKVGEWSLTDAHPPENVRWSDVLPLKDVLQSFPRIDLTSDEMDDARCGRPIEHTVSDGTIGWYEELPVAILISKGDGWAHARKVF